MNTRRSAGSFLAEYAGVIVIVLLALTFPLLNLATSSYRYNMLVSAVHKAAFDSSTAPTFTGSTGVAGVVPATMNNYLQNAKGISNFNVKYRINESDIKTATVTHHGWGQKLSSPADDTKTIYSIEVVVDADISPLVTMAAAGFVPAVPGLTGPSHVVVASQQMTENSAGLND